MASGPKFLVIDGYTKESREQLVGEGASMAADLYVRMLTKCSPPGTECDVLFPADEGASFPSDQQGTSLLCADIQFEAAEKTAQDITDSGGRAVAVRADISKAADCEKMVAMAEENFGKLDILFNNAGIMHSEDGTTDDTSEATWDLTMNINLKGVFFGCKYGIPALRRAGGGSIINTASFVAHLGAATPQVAYTASKGGVLALTRELAVLHARENIRVNALCPGSLRTELLMKFLDTEEKKQRRLVHIPMGRFGEAKEMAQAALFLASDASSYMTGSEFLVDGGISAAYVTPE